VSGTAENGVPLHPLAVTLLKKHDALEELEARHKSELENARLTVRDAARQLADIPINERLEIARWAYRLSRVHKSDLASACTWLGVGSPSGFDLRPILISP
jgi:acyl-CoA reductase-like NAD-dependent aldehyde dehydrogenase